MPDDKVKSLWGRDFRIVREGLAEADITSFVEALLLQLHEAEQKLVHVDTLHELARKSVITAEALAMTIVQEARREAESQAARITLEAEETLRALELEMSRRAQERASALISRATGGRTAGGTRRPQADGNPGWAKEIRSVLRSTR